MLAFEICDHALEENVRICATKLPYLAPFPLETENEFYLNGILDVNADEKSLTISAEIGAFWEDTGVSLTGNDSSLHMPVNEPERGAIWHPVYIFENLLNFERIGVFGSVAAAEFAYEGDQEMYYSEEFKLKIFCDFDFSDFPFDSHECPFTWGEDEEGSEKIKLLSASIWYGDLHTSPGQDPIVINDLPLPFEFTLSSIPQFDRAFDKNYSYTGMTLTIRRHSLGLLLSSYFYPTGSFALLSLISFFIHADVVII